MLKIIEKIIGNLNLTKKSLNQKEWVLSQEEIIIVEDLWIEYLSIYENAK